MHIIALDDIDGNILKIIDQFNKIKNVNIKYINK